MLGELHTRPGIHGVGGCAVCKACEDENRPFSGKQGPGISGKTSPGHRSLLSMWEGVWQIQNREELDRFDFGSHIGCILLYISN
ncbi:hypothetical protein CEXT_788181 [Caerostris extrusa]|uniref:Uncharacterized protein n=1 Tax=Caerostris extrusa TaxID=172846 RepID=A0AAV4S554_CAEEX|nr:hypothetical protein CEXT_788181 [Caerostris extrusa]